MQPTLCSKCKKNVAVVFISKLENGKTVNEGLCLKCAKEIGLPQVNDLMNRMGITDEDLDTITSEMMQAFGGAENLEGLMEAGSDDSSDDEEDEEGKTATFPFLNRLFSSDSSSSSPAPTPAADREEKEKEKDKGGRPKDRKQEKKRKFLDNYCINLTDRAREGKLDAVIGREQEI